MSVNDLKETIKQIALAKMTQAEALISGSGQGSIKLDYVVNLVLDEVKKLPMPAYMRIMIVIFQFAFKSEIRQEVQKLFDEFKTEINQGK